MAAVPEILAFTAENVINAVHNENVLWDSVTYASEEQQQLQQQQYF